MHDFHSFSPLSGERFPRCRPNLSMATPVPERMQDRFGQVYRYVGPMVQSSLAPGQIRVFPGHIYERSGNHAQEGVHRIAEGVHHAH